MSTTSGGVERVTKRPTYQRRELSPLDTYHACSACGEIRNMCKSLDNKPICSGCLDDKLHGADRKICANRGYHETHSTSSDSSRWHRGGVTAHCKCTAAHAFWGMPSERSGGMVGMPEPPRYWKNDGTVVEGN